MHYRWVRLPCVLLVAAAAIGLAAVTWRPQSGSALAAPPSELASPTFEPADCMFTLPVFDMAPESRGFECGYVTVPERHAAPDGPTLRIPVAILRAPAEAAQPDPLFVAQGGPGGDAFQVYSLLMPGSPMAETRDIVIFNQRGAAYADPDLRCTEVFDLLPQVLPLPPDEAMPRFQQAYADCHQRLSDQGINLSAFNSLENAGDVDSIRQALGYDQINFYGVSYGTLLGLHLMHLYPDHLRSVILDGVVPPQLNFIPLVPQETDRVFTRLFDACAADAGCSADYPNLEQRFFKLVDRLSESPITIPVTDSETGQTVDVYVDDQMLLDIVFQLLYAPDAYATFPRMVADMEAGDYDYVQAIWPEVVFDRTTSDGMYYSVICAEDADIVLDEVPLAGIRPQIAEEALKDIQENYLDVCADWQVTALPPSVDDPVTSDIPTLLLSGQFDPITPQSYAEAAAAHLSRSYSYVYPGGSHGVMRTDDCVDSIVMAFLADPLAQPDGGCLANVPADEFVPANAIRLPLVRQVAAMETEAVARLIIAGLCLGGLWSAFLVWPLARLLRWVRKKPAAARRWTRTAQLAVFLFGMLALVYVGGLSYYVWESLSGPMAGLSVVPAAAAPFLLLAWLLLPLALAILILGVVLWNQRSGPILGRLYYSVMALCALVYVVMLIREGTLTALFG